jgi:hypothetical protein
MTLVLKFSAVLAAAVVSGAVAVPLGIFVGLHPVAVLGVASATAILVAWGLAFASERVRVAVMARLGRSENAAGRAQRVVDRFGAIGLGLVAPALGVDRRRLSIWLTVGIVAWFAVFTVSWWLVHSRVAR